MASNSLSSSSVAVSQRSSASSSTINTVRCFDRAWPMMIPVLSRALPRLGVQPARERSKRFRNSFSGHVVKVRSQAGCQRTWNFERIEQKAGRMTHCTRLPVRDLPLNRPTRGPFRLWQLPRRRFVRQPTQRQDDFSWNRIWHSCPSMSAP
jgi:hypothetical protein